MLLVVAVEEAGEEALGGLRVPLLAATQLLQLLHVTLRVAQLHLQVMRAHAQLKHLSTAHRNLMVHV